MKDLLQDLRYAVRAMSASPLPTAVAILALTLGIGANTAIFSVVSTLLLRPLPYKDSERLVAVWSNKLSKGMREQPLSALDFQDFLREQTVFDQMAALRAQAAVLTGGDLPERVAAASVSPSLLSMLGVTPSLGRIFTAQESQPGKNHVAILSDGLWRRRFGGDWGILGKPLILDGSSYTIVGVTSRDFRLPDTAAELWIPYTPDPKDLAPNKRTYRVALKVIAHLRPGVTLEDAQDELRRIAHGLEEQYYDSNAGYSVDIVPLREQLIGNIRPTLWTLTGAVAFVLLIACANVANLLLARAGGREKEMAVRTALGANPWRLVRQLLTESVLLSLVSGVAGMLLAYSGVSLLLGLAAANLPRISEVSIDWRVLLFTLAVSIATGILFGLAPAFATVGADLNSVLKTGRSTTGNRGRAHLRNTLVIAEIACCVVLLTGAGLLIRSFLRLMEVNPGFRTDHLLTMQISLPETRYSGLKVGIFYRQLLARVASLPGTQTAAVSRYLPLGGSDASLNFRIESQPILASVDQPRAKYRAVSPGYFQAMGIPLIKGRYFNESDGERTPDVAIINEATARRYWPNADPVGRRIQSGISENRWATIVGIVGNVKHTGLDAAINEETYYHYLQVPVELMSFVEGTMSLVVRTASEPEAMTVAIRNELQSLDADEPVFNVRTMKDLVEGSVAQQRFRALLLCAFAGLALVLASIGLYGVIAYSVEQRTSELGVRTALGAQRSDILGLVVRHGLGLAVIGIGFGVVLALGLTRMLNKLLFGVGSLDAITFAGTCVLILAVALAASYIPALRATRVDPVSALKNE